VENKLDLERARLFQFLMLKDVPLLTGAEGSEEYVRVNLTFGTLRILTCSSSCSIIEDMILNV